MILVLFVLIMTLLGSYASLLLKKAAVSDTLIKIFININLYWGCILYCLAAILNIYILKFLDYSIVLPLTSLTYAWTLIISKIYLNEELSKKKIIGVIMIVIGAIFVSISNG